MELDVALLLIPAWGFLPYDDPRVIGTIEAVQDQLFAATVSCCATGRSRAKTDYPAAGAFLACSFWLADALAGIGRTGQATDLFERILKLRNDVGLLRRNTTPGTQPPGRQHPAGNFSDGRIDQHRTQIGRQLDQHLMRAATNKISAPVERVASR